LDVEPTVSTSPGRATGSGRSSSASAKLKMAVLAPMPIASDSTATAAKPGLPANMRPPYCTSCHTRSSHVRTQLEGRRSVMTGCSRGLDDCGHGLVLFLDPGSLGQFPRLQRACRFCCRLTRGSTLDDGTGHS